MKELSIGETGVIEGITVKCVKFELQKNMCNACVFWTADCRKDRFNCCKENRTDHNDVIYKLIEDEN